MMQLKTFLTHKDNFNAASLSCNPIELMYDLGYAFPKCGNKTSKYGKH